MQYLSYGLPLALLVSGSFANPLERRDDWAACTSDACLAAVTGKAALGDDSLRKGHCASYLATTVTPPAVTVTATVTGESWDQNWKRASVTVCPNEVPNYASACDEAAYTSACSCYGFTDVVTTTLAPTTTTKTVYVAPTSCASGGATTVTVTAGGSGGSWASTVTVTVTSATATVTSAGTCTSGSWPTGSPTPASCIVTDALASGIVFNFTQLLERTSFPGSANPYIPAGSGYPQDISNATLADDFSDISDSINFMAGFPVSFPVPRFPCPCISNRVISLALSLSLPRNSLTMVRVSSNPK